MRQLAVTVTKRLKQCQQPWVPIQPLRTEACSPLAITTPTSRSSPTSGRSLVAVNMYAVSATNFAASSGTLFAILRRSRAPATLIFQENLSDACPMGATPSLSALCPRGRIPTVYRFGYGQRRTSFVMQERPAVRTQH